MTSRTPLTDESLRAINVPKALREELLEVDALNLPGPMPTEQLVAATLERCREVLNRRPEAKPDVGVLGAGAIGPAFAALLGRTMPASALESQLAAFYSNFASEAVRFAAKNPDEAAVVVVDDFSAIDAERWLSEPSLVLMDGTLNRADFELALASWRPMDRVIIARDDPSTYGGADLMVIRRALCSQPSSNTYLVAGGRMRRMGKYQCAVVGDEVVFEVGKDDAPGALIDEPRAHRNPARASEIRAWVSAAKSKGVRLSEGGQFDSRVESAIRSRSTQPLLDILMSVK